MNKQNVKKPAARQPSSFRRWLPIGLAITAGLCFLVVLVIILLFYLNPFDTAASISRPLVLIDAPADGDQVVIGDYTTIHAVARDDENIVRVEFWVDDTLKDVQTSSLEDGISPFPFLADWMPTEIGRHILAVRAFNNLGARAHGSISVEVIASEDRDGDGAVDAADSCPDEPGPASDDGCPIPGDADGDEILDADDACPGVPGTFDDDGCPDRDGDGVPDHLDAAPDEPGPAETDGAPDTDGDGVPDIEDLAPEEMGAPEGGGAPESGAGDRDGDGAADDVDPCPDDAGEPEDGFCPPPEDDPIPEAGGSLFDDPPGFFDDNDDMPISLEIEAYEFSVSGDYTNVWCYLQLNDEDIVRYEFDPEGDRYWNIAESLSGVNSVRMAISLDEPLSVFLDCWAETIYLLGDPSGEGPGEIGAWGTTYNLGSYTFTHSSEDWGGGELFGFGSGPDGESFWARYHICSPSCDEAAIQPPILDPITLDERGIGPSMLRWRWDGDEDTIEGFLLSVNGTYYNTSRSISPESRSLNISDFEPGCGEVLEFQMQAFGSDWSSSTSWRTPPSNTQTWDGGTCPRTVMVTFSAFDTAGMGRERGPISGTFFANDSMLIADFRDGPPSFDATDDTERYLRQGNYYPLSLLFRDIEAEAASCVGSPCTRNYAPSVNYLEIDLGDRETLTFGARISEPGSVGNVFNATISIPPGEIVPGPYVVGDNGISLIVLVDVLVGPEAGTNPDLVIQDVVAPTDGGDLYIDLFNNAADLVDQDVTINLVQMQTGEDLGTITRNITIPSGASVRVAAGMDIPPYDLRLTLDPENTITETDAGEHNNIYETPVTIRVEFAALGNYGGPCESFLGQIAEFRFRLKVGHRPTGDAPNWVWERNYPWTGTVEYNYRDDPNHTWELSGDPLFVYEFDMPPADSLVIWGDGFEDDPGASADDYAGSFMTIFSPEENYGSRTDQHVGISSGYLSCPDGPSLGWGSEEDGIWVSWIITRVH